MAMVVIITVVTVAIMSIESVSPIRLSIVVLSFCIGLVMIWLSAIQALAYFPLASLPDDVAKSLADGEALTPMLASRAGRAYDQALSWLPHNGELLRTRGRLRLRDLNAETMDGAHRGAILSSASGYFKNAISEAPANPYSWALELNSQVELHAHSEHIFSLYRMSAYQGPIEASSLLTRLRVAVQFWPFLPNDIRELAARDIRQIWLTRALRRELINQYISASYVTRSDIRKIALVDAAAVTQFDRMVRRAVRGGK